MRPPPLAWRNLTHQLRRSFAAMLGVVFAVLLVFVQAAALDGARINVARLYSLVAADLVITDRGYVTATRSASVSRARLLQAANVAGVARVGGLMVESVRWRNVRAGGDGSCVLLGVSPEVPLFAEARLNAQLPRLRQPAAVLLDRESRPRYGPWAVGDPAELAGRPVEIVGDYALGFGLIADGSAIMSEDTFARLLGDGARDRPSLGFVQFAPGADPAEVTARLRAALPPDVTLATKAEMIRREQRHFLTVKPVGIIFQVGMMVAFIAGAVLLGQTLSAEITDRLPEFATMKALGHSAAAVYGVGLRQALLLALAAYGPALALAAILGASLRRASGFPVEMTAARAGFVGLLTLAMCAIAAAFAFHRLRRADPAALYVR
ncbi:MAG: hypothetical protein RLZZ15_1893 [Verrucomicrobiota bacterium]|jgi:putative ABC transport system permease protein